MMKRILACGLLLATVGTASAETVVWYQFDQASGTTVVNLANPGTHDGAFRSIHAWEWPYTFGSDTEKYPTYSGVPFAAGWGVYEPVLKKYCAATNAVSWSQKSHPGVIVAPHSEAYPTRNMTVEAFVRLPTDAHRANSGNPAMHPIAQHGIDSRSGWIFSIYNGKPFFRWCAKKASTGTCGYKINLNLAGKAPASSLPDAFTLYDGRWHHIAATIDNSGTSRIYLDYECIAWHKAPDDFGGIYFERNDNALNNELVLGAAQTSEGRSLYGEIGGFRLSVTALQPENFLQPVSSAPVSEETHAFLPLGDCADAFGSPPSPGYTNRCWGIVNAVPSASAPRPRWAWPTVSLGTDLLPGVSANDDGTSVRASFGAPARAPDEKAIRFRHVSQSRLPGALVVLPHTGTSLAASDFTLEWFFKIGDAKKYDRALVMFACTWAKIMVNNTGCVYTRLVRSMDSAHYNSEYTDKKVDDDAWHHYALVYRKATHSYEVWIDYANVYTKTLLGELENEGQLVFGGLSTSEQVFDGSLDNLRIVRRALGSHEFLTRRAYVSSHAMDARFEGALDAGVDSVLGGAGTGGALAGGEVPSFAAVSYPIDADNDGVRDYFSTHALKLNKSTVLFPRNRMLESRNLTIEFFGKFSTVANNAALLRFGQVNEAGEPDLGGTLAWGFYCPSSKDVPGTSSLRIGGHVSRDGAWASIYRQDLDFAVNSPIADNAWHHWALTVQSFPSAEVPNTTFTLYRDYEPYGKPVVLNKNGTGGILAFPSRGTCLTFGGGDGLVGYYDELRIREGVHEPSTFMRRLPTGLAVILR